MGLFDFFKKKGPQLTKDQQVAQERFLAGQASVRDLIAPAAYEVKPNYLQLNESFVRSFYVYTYPRYLETNWLAPIIDYDITADLSMFIYPQESAQVMRQLKQQIARLQSSYQIELEKGMVRDPELETAVQDIESLRDTLQRGEDRLFIFGLYLTIYASSPEELETISKQLESTLGGILVYTKRALFQMEDGFTATLPLGIDTLRVHRNLDTMALSTTFPFSSSTLTQSEGILYGINKHNNSLIIFDRFSLPNANCVVFATSGAGKSYTVKLEALRGLMLGTEIIIIDPENEYQKLAEAVGGTFLNVSLNSPYRINPFDLPVSTHEEDAGMDVLRSSVITLHGLIRLMLGGTTTPDEDAIIDRALYETYAIKDITDNPASHQNPPPILADFVGILSNMRGAEAIGKRLEKFVSGTFAGLFNQPTNLELDKPFVVFSIRDLEDELRPIAMYLVLNFIWTRVRKTLKKRLMIVDEAWWMMQFEESAKFLFGLAKRARKYYLGLTIISQDVEDFLGNKYGKAVVSNSAMQVLLKQTPAAAGKVAEVFNLTEGEKLLLLQADRGEGLFFAGLNHVYMKVIASYTEDQIITTDPRKILEEQQAAQAAAAAQAQAAAPAPTPVGAPPAG